ncbi:MAG: ABC transporter ATP-binding protein [Erysipelotrichaceae bacterium]|nr:ABC transporter ATP-binding protein [Erysipelotrichaceae bacterium]
MSKPMIEIDHVTKEYRLGAIGGTTLNAEIQSKIAKLRGKEDPNLKIGTNKHRYGELFKALDGVTFDVQPGEAVGIIGHNGAGKSTLLKLISRVTAPTSGEIRLRGRVASMLEVGTGFHPELTGRENVYLNGAILGMTKAEIDSKFSEIVEFAEMEQFIDTPVKRYSSGMYVKLAFSVAAHLDSEIMIMDEVLAVGDAKFQSKCLSKMNDAAHNSGKTILYVSHNMGTIQRLCDRCIVLDHGHNIFDGSVDEAIGIYLKQGGGEGSIVDLSAFERNRWVTKTVKMTLMRFVGKDNCVFLQNSNMIFDFYWETSANADIQDLVLRCTFYHQSGVVAAFTTIGLGNAGPNEKHYDRIEISLQGMIPGNYYFTFDMNEVYSDGSDVWNDSCDQVTTISIEKHRTEDNSLHSDYSHMLPWRHSSYGSVCLASTILEEKSDYDL